MVCTGVYGEMKPMAILPPPWESYPYASEAKTEWIILRTTSYEILAGIFPINPRYIGIEKPKSPNELARSSFAQDMAEGNFEITVTSDRFLPTLTNRGVLHENDFQEPVPATSYFQARLVIAWESNHIAVRLLTTHFSRSW
jgi:hypothetical protein